MVTLRKRFPRFNEPPRQSPLRALPTSTRARKPCTAQRARHGSKCARANCSPEVRAPAPPRAAQSHRHTTDARRTLSKMQAGARAPNSLRAQQLGQNQGWHTRRPASASQGASSPAPAAPSPPPAGASAQRAGAAARKPREPVHTRQLLRAGGTHEHAPQALPRAP